MNRHLYQGMYMETREQLAGVSSPSNKCVQGIELRLSGWAVCPSCWATSLACFSIVSRNTELAFSSPGTVFGTWSCIWKMCSLQLWGHCEETITCLGRSSGQRSKGCQPLHTAHALWKSKHSLHGDAWIFVLFSQILLWCVWVCLFVCLSICLCLCLCVSMSVCLCVLWAR